MTEWLERLEPDASEAAALGRAVRSTSMRWADPARVVTRWTAPGYHRWRTTLYDFHADKAGEILRDVGYDDATIARVQSLVARRGSRPTRRRRRWRM